MPPTADQLLELFKQRDVWLFFALFVIGGLYWIAASAEGQIDEYHRANPGAKAMYDAWRRQKAWKSHARVPTTVICPLHKVFRDQCPPGSHDEGEPK